MQSENIDQLAKALAVAQGAMKAATYNRINPHFKNKYADLAAVWDAIREPLSKNGLSVTQTMERVLVGDAQGTDIFLQTTLRHASGQWVCSYYPLPIGAKPQEMGSALTYARRYSLSAIVGIASDEDDDANEAEKVEVKPKWETKLGPAIEQRAAELKVNTLKRPVADPIPLSDPQYDQMMLYVSELDTDRLSKFLTWLNVKSTGDIKAHQYDRAMAGLRKAVGRTLGGEQADNVPTPTPEEVRS